jgi:uncharacterized membrane protein YgdD (TMEM256/DUF423 family)
MALHDLPCLQYLPARIGALLAAAAIGLSAWASHGLEPGRAQYNVLLACVYAFAHGAVLVLAAGRVRTVAGVLALWLLLAGMLLFAGSLVGNALAGWPTAAAPLGGMTMIAGWLLLAWRPVAGPRG